MTLDQSIEAVLFAAAKSFTVRQLADVSDASAKEVEAALTVLAERLNASGSGVMLQRMGNEIEIVTRPEAAEIVKRVIHAETQGELTRAALETLTILAYRGPLTRPEIEQIRGIQSSIIVRNLLLRGLIEQKEDHRLGQPTYAVTLEFLNHLGLPGVEDLPEYEALHRHETVEQILADLAPAKPITNEAPSLKV